MFGIERQKEGGKESVVCRRGCGRDGGKCASGSGHCCVKLNPVFALFIFDSGKWRHLCPLAATLTFPYSIRPFLMQFLSFPPLRVLSFSASYFWPHGWREAVWVILLLFLLLSSNWTRALNTTVEKIMVSEDGNKKYILYNLCKTWKKTRRVIRTSPEK